MNMIKVIEKTKNGFGIIIKDPEHFLAHLDVIDVLPELIQQLEVSGRYGRVTVQSFDAGKIIGRSGVVKTNPEDNVFFRARDGRKHASRCVTGRLGDETTVITFVYRFLKNDIELITAYFGPPSPREPGDTTIESDLLRQESIKFWNEHAIVIKE